MYTTFDPEAWQVFKADMRSGPVHMLNLISLRARAEYADDREASGTEAYAAYSRISAPVIARLGVTIAWRGRHDHVLVGPAAEQWDICFIAAYPGRAAFMELMRDPLYREALVHRQAAVRDSRLLALAPLEAGSAFAG